MPTPVHTGTSAPAALGLEVAAESATAEADSLDEIEAVADELATGDDVAAAPPDPTKLLAEADTDADADAEAEVELSDPPIPPPIPGRPLMSISSARSPHRSSRADLSASPPV